MIAVKANTRSQLSRMRLLMGNGEGIYSKIANRLKSRINLLPKRAKRNLNLLLNELIEFFCYKHAKCKLLHIILIYDAYLCLTLFNYHSLGVSRLLSFIYKRNAGIVILN